MIEEIDFRVIIKKLDEAAIGETKILRKRGFKVYDLRESEIVKDSDNSYVESVYILCCRGNKKDYEQFKNTNNFYEEIYEGFKTLLITEEA